MFLLHFDIYVVLLHAQLKGAVAWTGTWRDDHTHRAESPKYESKTLLKKNQAIRRAKKKLTSLVSMTYDSKVNS